ncbi:hypothetical protein ON010_g5856 [Phytophthora cinnamomi]|nr:hypothetical protein ON010_g5856 [Phytophthora cinnamomi]
MGASLAEIPTGRNYDSPPDASDEPVYDALEKAYNAAFLVHPLAENEDAEAEERLAQEEKADSGGGEQVAGLKGVDKVGVAAVWSALGISATSTVEEQSQQVGTLKSMCLSTLKQNDGHNEVKDAPMDGFNGLPKVTRPDTGSESKRSSGGVVDQMKTPASLSATSVVTTASPPQSPMSAYHRTSSEDGFLSTPEAKREPRDVVMKPEIVDDARVARADHLSLNEFLISELGVYCSRLLGKGLLDNDLSRISDLARITSLQLFQDHQRALMDFDDEWKRSHADNRQGYTPAATSEVLPMARTMITTNPFQHGTGSVNVNEWAALLNGVKASSTESTPLGTSYFPNVDIEEGSKDLFAAYQRGSNGVVIGGDSCQGERMQAWNSAALYPDQIRTVCDVVKAFLITSNLDDSAAFISNVEACTTDNSKREVVTLDTLNKQGIVREIEPSIMVPVKRVLLKKSRSRTTAHIPAKVSRINVPGSPLDQVDSQLTVKAPTAVLKKRRGSDGMYGSRQRIGRCGKCAGCLTEDCMKCGHCQDMKKYGGPGLRKQSCKNRKCLNPRIWGLASRKRKRSKAKRVDVKGDLELDEDGSVAYSSVESDGDSVSTATYENGDSDAESFIYSDATTDSPRDLLLPASDTVMSDHLSLSDLSSRSGSARSRVVRCGECEGCHAPDCKKCPHCLDMKKYGGPGLRKQTCKNRKCNGPKVVMLNNAKGGQFVDEMGNVVYSGLNDSNFPGFYEAPDTPDSTGAAASPRIAFQSDLSPVVRECELFVKPRLEFACKDCAARFNSELLLAFHARVEHSQSVIEDVGQISFEQKASKLLVRPIYQNAMLIAQIKQQTNSPLGYAKLEHDCNNARGDIVGRTPQELRDRVPEPPSADFCERPRSQLLVAPSGAEQPQLGADRRERLLLPAAKDGYGEGPH